MNTDNNNNNNNIENKRNEVLFWKVFHNKYILNHIINQIHNTEWVKYDDPDRIIFSNRYKFKNIQELSFMLSNKLYSLIRHKNEYKDYIEINNYSIHLLFNQITEDQDQETQRYKHIVLNKKTTFEERVELKSILITFLNERRIEFEIFDLTKIAVECNSIEALRILINEPYSIIVYPSTLELAIRKCRVEIVKELIKSPTIIITDKIRTNSFALASETIGNSTLKTAMVKFILDNPILYKLKEERDEQPTKKLKTSHNYCDLVTKIQFDKFLSLNCNDTKSKLLDLNLVSYSEKLDIGKSLYLGSYEISELNLFIYQSFEEISTRLKIQFKFKVFYKEFNFDPVIQLEFQDKVNQIINFSNNNGEEEEQYNLKKLHKLIAIHFKDYEFYSDYKLKYEDNIEECESHFGVNTELIGDFRRESFIYKFKKSIKECDIKQLDCLKPRVTEDHMNQMINMKSKLELPSSKEDIIKLIDYFNGNECKLNDFYIHSTDFYSQVVNKAGSGIEPCSIKLKIVEVPDYQVMVLQFMESIKNIKLPDFKLVELYLHALKVIPFRSINVSDQGDYEFLKEIMKSNSFDDEHKIKFITTLTIDLVIEIIQVFIYNYPKNLVINFIEDNNTIQIVSLNTILNYFYSLSLRIKGVLLDQINQVRQLLLENSIIIDHGVIESILYLQIRNPKLSKYAIDHPMLDLHPNLFDGEDYLEFFKFDILTFDYIFGHDGDDIYINSFDFILNELIDQLSNKVCYDIQHSEFRCYLSSLEYDLDYFLDIRRVDLFFKRLEWIYQFIIDENNPNQIEQSFIFNSASTLIKSTSTLFKDKNKPSLPLGKIQNEQQESSDDDGGLLLLPISNTIPIFKLSNRILISACVVMNIEEIQQLIEFKFYESNFINHLFKLADHFELHELVSFLLDNYLFVTPTYINLGKGYCYLDFILSNYSSLVKYPVTVENSFSQYVGELFKQGFLIQYLYSLEIGERSNIDTTLSRIKDPQNEVDMDKLYLRYIDFENPIIDSINIKKPPHSVLINKEIQQVLKGKLDDYFQIKNLKLQEIGKEHCLKYSSRVINILFLRSFIYGDIKSCDTIIQHYANYPFKITQYAITETIKCENIHIIKYYYQSLIKNDIQLLDQLKSQLCIHDDYQYHLNWLN